MTLRLLEGVRVIEWAEGLSAPFCARILADLGAEVVKVEPPGGDRMRAVPPLLPFPDGGALFAYVNAGKRSLALDPMGAGAERFQALLRGAALLVHSRPEPFASTVGEPPPGLVVLSVTPFGRTGPMRGTPCSDLTLQHRGSWAYAMARPVSDPEAVAPLGGADREGPLAIGVAGAAAALWGLLVVQAGGAAPRIDLASDDFYAFLAFEALVEWSAGERAFPRRRVKREGTEAAGGLTWILPCAQGWVMVSPREQHQWEKWVGLLGSPAWSADAALCGSRVARRTNFFQLQKLMAAWSRQFAPAELAQRAQAAGVACFPVSTPGELLANAQLLHRGFFDRLETGRGEVPVPGLPFSFTAANGAALPRERVLHSPALGEADASLA